MLPVLLDLRFIKIYTFGVFLVLAFFWGSFILWRNIRLTSYKENEIFDGLFLSLFGSLFFARLVFVIFNFEKFGFNILKFILINGYPGLSLIGGLFGGFLFYYFYFKTKKIQFREAVDYLVTPVLVALTFGKLGSFFAGVDVGTRTKLPLAIRYIGYDGGRHLTAFYEFLFFAVGAYITYRLLFEIRKERYSHGFVFMFFCWYFALTYFVFDKLKVNHLYLLGQSFNLVVSGLTLLTFTIYFVYYFRRSFLHYAKTAFKKITKTALRQPSSGSKQNQETDRGSKKK